MPCTCPDVLDRKKHKIVAGQRPRKARRSFLDPEGVALPRAAGRQAGEMSPEFDPCRVEPCWGRVFLRHSVENSAKTAFSSDNILVSPRIMA
jgi:hypothetical protein